MKLAFDVGGYDGADTAHYLSLGYTVVCIEASPALADRIRERFPREIAEGRCEVLNIGVGEVAGRLPFYLSKYPIWNSFDRRMAARAGEVQEVSVEIRPLCDVMAEYEPAEFVKIDVEGADAACLRSMVAPFPQFISFEASRADGADLIALLMTRGYTRFSLVRQDSFAAISIPKAGTLPHVTWSLRQVIRMKLRGWKWLHPLVRTFARNKEGTHPQARTYVLDSAGPTPMERTDGWKSATEFLWLWQNIVDSGMIDSTWYDIHAARPS
jgi:FkbM family methyltransferase